MLRTPLNEITTENLKAWIEDTAPAESDTWDFKGHRPDKWNSSKLLEGATSQKEKQH